MTTPSTTFAGNLQDRLRLPGGNAFGDVLEELLPCIPIHRIDGAGEVLTVPRIRTADITLTSLAGWRAVGASPTSGEPLNSSVEFTLQRLDSEATDDLTLAHANTRPNPITEEDAQLRWVAIARRIADALVNGGGNTNTGFLGWENMTDGSTRTDVTASGTAAINVLNDLMRIDDACKAQALGRRASAFVTNPQGRRNIEIAAIEKGTLLEYRMVGGLENEVPYFRGRPILATEGLATAANAAPLYAVDFNYVFLLTTTGSAASLGIEPLEMPLQAAGTIGRYQWFHGTCIVRHPRALVRTTVTTALAT